LVIPNPQPAPAKASTLVELMYAHGKRWELKKERAGEVDTHGAHSIHASGVGAHLRRHLAVQDKGRAVLAALQQELYEQGEQVRVLVVRRAHGQRLRQFALSCRRALACSHRFAATLTGLPSAAREPEQVLTVL
jgi:hypothetical protein